MSNIGRSIPTVESLLLRSDDFSVNAYNDVNQEQWVFVYATNEEQW